MCGIAGIVGEGAAEHLEALRRMVAALAHRGPDGEGTHVSPSKQCLLGHRRLAIIDLSAAAAQPMLTPDSRFAFVYNGELYNFKDLRHQLTAGGERFKSSGDTEVLLRLLAREGEAALPRLNGMFAFALWDERERRLLLARDRFGQKPLYYARIGPLFLFASEVRALLASGLAPRKLNAQALAGYLSNGAVQEPDTIVQAISPLPRATALTLAPGGNQALRCYWTPGVEKRPCSPVELRDALVAAVERHLISDAPAGLFLSGGIDSSAIAAAARCRGGEIKSLAVVFPDQPLQSEAAMARTMADHAGTQHQEVRLTGTDMLALLPAALAAMDQPTGDAINTFVVSCAARQAGLKVALSGLGGDELFGGYPSFADIRRAMRFHSLCRPLRGPLAAALSASRFSKRAGKLADVLDSPGDVLAAYLVRRRVFSSRQIRLLMPDIVSNGWLSGQAPERLAALEALTRDRELPDATALLELDVYMGQMLLRDSDVMGMAHGLEIRMPFLDADFADRALALEASARLAKGRSKWRLVEALGEWLPPVIRNRGKHGFALPFAEWLPNELRSEVGDGLRTLARVCPVLNGKATQRLWNAFCAAPQRLGWMRPWSLYVLGRFLSEQRLVS
jgi:asparagine synthase (glutamine-hydrolysing)